MTSTARRVLVLVLVLSLALTACGRGGTRVTADDGRGIDRPGGGIWIPETRGGDLDDAAPASEEDDADAEREPTQAESDAGVARVSDGGETATDEPRVPELPSPRRPAAEASAPAPSPEPPVDDSDADRADEHAEPVPEEDEQEADDEPAEPEVVSDCGVAATQEQPARDALEEEVARLRGLIAEDWPDTQAGVWILSEEDRLSVHVGFTRGVRASLQAACQEFGYPELLHGVRTELSEAELQQHLEEVLAERDALREGTPPEDLPDEIRSTRGRYVASVDHAANGLLVTVEAPSERLRDSFRDRYIERLQLAEGRFDEDGEPVVREGE